MRKHEVLNTSRHSDYVVDIENLNSINTLFTKTGQVDAIICAAGNASFGAFSTLTEDQFNLGIKSKLMGQVNVRREGLGKLKPKGVIILTGGTLAHDPWPETTNIAMVNAALEGFVKALALELTEGRRILVVHPPLIKETAEMMRMDGNQYPSASEVAGTYLQGLESNENGRLFMQQTINHSISNKYNLNI
ncbi:MAG: short chain dehydrogenase [Balneolaceae bacterium]|nr:short chain dehydrogenase [Balneolaceae bacterium]